LKGRGVAGLWRRLFGKTAESQSMVVYCLLCVVFGAVISVLLWLIGAALTFLFQGGEMAEKFLGSYAVDFNGILVGATSYGLLFFTLTRGPEVMAELGKILNLPGPHAARVQRLWKRSGSWVWMHLISLPLTAAGVLVFLGNGFPLEGFAKVYLGVGVNSIWYLASTVLAFLVYSLSAFSYVDHASRPQSVNRISAKERSATAFEVIDDFFILCPALGLAAIYIGFRASLSGFHCAEGTLAYKLLILPVLFYLPASLFYSLYPRFVLRGVFERDIVQEFAGARQQIGERNDLDLKGRLELVKLLYEVKEQTLREGRGSSLLGVKDIPSFTLSLLIVVHFILQKDTLVKTFFGWPGE
jgi:hypothetical protein